MIPTLILFIKKLAYIFQKPKVRVRRIVGAKMFYGTVEQEHHVPRLYCPEKICYWTVRWDEQPAIWLTYPASHFQWVRGMHTAFDTK